MSKNAVNDQYWTLIIFKNQTSNYASVLVMHRFKMFVCRLVNN